MRIFFIIPFIFFSTLTCAQLQDEMIIVKDTAYLYSSPTSNSNITYKLNKYEIVLTKETEMDVPQWIYVETPYNKFSKLKLSNYRNYHEHEDFYASGYILRSNLIPIEEIPSYNGQDCGIEFKIQKADTSIKLEELSSIIYGIEIPLNLSFSVSEMHLIWKEKSIIQNDSLYDDLFNITFEQGLLSSLKDTNDFEVYKIDEVYLIKHHCADGAGYYEITWVIKNGEIIGRLIDDI